MAPRRPPAPVGAGPAAATRRPAPAARPRSTEPPPPRRTRITVRGALFTGVAVVGLASVLGPLREYTSQRSDLSALTQDVTARQARVASLQRQVDRWDDPAYVSAQARARLHDVLPGETGYVVVDLPAASPTASATAAASGGDGSGSLLRRLQDSLGIGATASGEDADDDDPLDPSTGATP